MSDVELRDDLQLQGAGDNFERIGTYSEGVDADAFEKMKKKNIALRLENGRLRKSLAAMEEKYLKLKEVDPSEER